jgi:imidazolonepropionase-like amidohydrolase
MKSLIATTFAALIAASPAAAANVTYIHAGSLLDRPGEKPRGASTIIVRDDKVAEVREGFVPPEGDAALVDLKDRFVLPGLIDMHVHLLGIGGDPLKARLTAINTELADDVMYGAGNARATLHAGFTTVRDLGLTRAASGHSGMRSRVAMSKARRSSTRALPSRSPAGMAIR